jgi:hypothetical protein
MFLWYPVLDLARAPRRTARKKGSGYDNGQIVPISIRVTDLTSCFSPANNLLQICYLAAVWLTS